MKKILNILFIFLVSGVFAQNNVGIGTKNPDLSAILEIADSNRGFLFPRTDTQSVENYVNSLSPNPGIAHGLTIFEVNMRTIYIYNGILQKWQPITSLVGPQGPTGATGPTGPRGLIGVRTNWRDSTFAPPIKQLPHPNNKPPYFETIGDTCGDFFHQTTTGLIWVYDCNVNAWTGPIARWRNFGVPVLEEITAPGLIEEPMPVDTSGNKLQLLGNLTRTILIPPDTVARVIVTSEGVVQKKYVDYDDYNRMVFDFFLIDSTGTGAYVNHQQEVIVGPHIQIPATTTSQADKTPWEISYTFEAEGKISPPGSPLPATDYRSWTIQTHFGQFFNPGNSTHPDSSRVIVLDNAGSVSNQNENWARMNIMIVFERSQNAPDPQ